MLDESFLMITQINPTKPAIEPKTVNNIAKPESP